MPKVAYIPYSADFDSLFNFCGISLPTSDFGGNEGWDQSAFMNALGAAEDYLWNQQEADDVDWDLLESYYSILNSDYSVFYWSTEKYVVD